MNDNAREQRLRRLARCEGMMIVKSRARDPLAEDYGRYSLVDDCTGNRVGRRGGQAAASALARGGMSLDEVEDELQGLAALQN